MSEDANKAVSGLWGDAASSAGAGTSGDNNQGQGSQQNNAGGSGQGSQQGQQGSGQQGSQQGQQGQGQGQQGQQGQQSQQQQQIALTPQQLADAFVESQKRLNQQGGGQGQQQQQQKQLSQEELDKAFNKFVVTPELYAQIFDAEKPEQSIAALNNLVAGAVKQAVTMAYHVMNDQFQQFDGRLKPYMSFADEQRETMLRNQYFEMFPTHKQLDPIIQQVHQQMKAEGYKASDMKGLFTEVGKRVDAIVNQLKTAAGITGGDNSGAGGQQQNNGGQQQASQKPKMSSLNSGGQGGEPGGSGGGGGGNKVKSLWG
jgi:hypothetical protein